MPSRFVPPPLTEAKKQSLVREFKAAEDDRELAAQRKANAVKELWIALGAVETAELLGINRQQVYRLADRANEEEYA